MTSVSFGLILAGVLLNAAAQLLLKAGTNAVGHFAFDAANIVPVGLRLAFEPHIVTGVFCYLASLVVWLM
ncbi:MAG: 4-amino-4-deoxy-L-arabinose transferase, partial [Rhodocyclales bacterium CG17_big_fil_post_rev_8_21_14_2_50_68_7]